MRGCMQGLAVLAALLFVTTAVLALLLVNGARILTNREALKEALALEVLLRQALPGVIGNVVEQQARAQNLPVPQLDTDTLSDAILDTFPAGWLDEVTETAVDGVLNYLSTGNPEQAVLTIDVSPVLTQWQGEMGQQAVLEIVQTLPICTDPAAFDLSSGTLPTCVPPGVPIEEMAIQLHSVIGSSILPPIVGASALVRLPLLSAETLTAGQLSILQRVQRLYALATQSWRLWLLPLFSLMAITLFAVRTLANWGYWWGWPMAAAGFIALMLALVLPALVTGVVRTAVSAAPTPGSLTAVWQPFLQQGIIALSVAWGRRVLLQAGGILVLGLIFVSYGFFAARQQAEQ